MAPPQQAMRLSYHTWSPKERDQYFHLQRNAKVKGTLWLDEDMMNKMGIDRQVKSLLRLMDLERLYEMKQPTFVQPTLQFLSTMEFNKGMVRGFDENLGFITFKIRNETYTISTKDLCDIYGFDRRRNEVGFRMGLDVDKLWKLIAFGKYDEEDSTITKIRNPTIRYTMEFLANTFFVHGNRHFLNNSAMHFLFQGLKQNLWENGGRWFDPIGNGANTGLLFVMFLLEHIAELQLRKKPIVKVGGMLTPIFRHCGIPLEEWRNVDDDEERSDGNRIEGESLDAQYLLDRKFIFGFGPSGEVLYTFIHTNRKWHVCNLPLKMWTTTAVTPTIAFTLPQNLAIKRTELHLHPTLNLLDDEEESLEEEDEESFGHEFLAQSFGLPHQRTTFEDTLHRRVKGNTVQIKKNMSMISRLWKAVKGLSKYNRYASSVGSDEDQAKIKRQEFDMPRKSMVYPPLMIREPREDSMLPPRHSIHEPPLRRHGKDPIGQTSKPRRGFFRDQDTEPSVCSSRHSYI